MSESVIEVRDISKRYRVGVHKKSNTLAEHLKDSILYPIKNFQRISNLRKFSDENDPTIYWALRDINFDVKEGEVLGIVGHNGAGKSTLLKILSRITEPTTGRASIKGRVSALLEVGTGFHHELTGRDNIYMNGTILGMRKKEIDRKFDEIVAFSGIERHIDTPVKFYSSGMTVRLAFSVAAHLEPEILIIDEVLAVGDAEFQKKCLGKMEDVAHQGRTVLFVSHNLTAVKNLCTRALLLKQGKIIKIDTPESVVNSYLSDKLFAHREGIEIEKLTDDGFVKMHQISLTSSLGLNNFDISKSFTLCLEVSILKTFDFEVNFNLFFKDGSNTMVFVINSTPQQFPIGSYKVNFEIPANFLNDNTYSLDAMVVYNDKAALNIPDAFSINGVELNRKGAWFGKYPGLIRPKTIGAKIEKING